MDMGVLIKLVGGLCMLGIGVRQALQTPLLRRAGVRSPGSVVRMHREWNPDENVWLYAPVVAFHDEHGSKHEFTADISTTWTSHQRGEQVTVLYPPGRPEVAWLKSGAHTGMRLVSAGLSAILILVGLLLLGSFVRGLLSAG
ncbi:DUF3592 domain-containing protein [Micromonospora zamorensis]|uniref:DUF3592 domain-containing protein n=1 Tax=Micromonospora zamorensis TaxID=709883 RepID=UPI0037B70F24